jgi:Flp pilus assembly protein TadD
LAPGQASILDTLGWVQYRRGAYQEASQSLAKAADLAPTIAPIQYHLGMAYARLGRKDDATLALRRALQLDPKLPEAPKIQETLRELGS